MSSGSEEPLLLFGALACGDGSAADIGGAGGEGKWGGLVVERMAKLVVESANCKASLGG